MSGRQSKPADWLYRRTRQEEVDLSIADYMNDAAKEMRRRSKAIRRDFAMHSGAAGRPQRGLGDQVP